MGSHDQRSGASRSMRLWGFPSGGLQLADPGMKEGSSGENVLERER